MLDPAVVLEHVELPLGASAVVALSDGAHSAATSTGELTEGSMLPSWSFTKTHIAAACLRLAGDGGLDLGRPVTDWIPEAGVPATVTLSRLLRHTGGVPDYGSLPEYHAGVATHPDNPWDDRRFLEVASRPLRFEPGTGWEYTNTGYFLLRLVLERECGRPLGEVLADTIWRPLGLMATSLLETPNDMGELSPGFSGMFGEGLEDVRHRYHPGWVGHRSAASTAADAARVLAGVLGDGLLSAESRRLMLEPTALPGVDARWPEPAYGMGLMLGRLPGAGIAGHSGGGPGYGVAVYRAAGSDGRKMTVAVLANREVTTEMEQLAVQLLGIALEPPLS